MENRQEDHYQETEDIIAALERMRRFAGPPSEFWPAFLENAAHLIGAGFAVLMVQGDGRHSWKSLCVWPVTGRRGIGGSDLKTRIEEVADASAYQGYARENAGSERAAEAEEALARANASTEVDFSELVYISSAGIGCLLAAHKRLSKSGGSLRLVNMNAHIRELFELAGFDMVFEID